MRAVVQTRYGGTDRLGLQEHPEPTPGPRDVLVRVQAAGVDRGTWHLMTGRPYAARLVGGVRRTRVPVPVPGRDVAGVVEAVGDQVADVSVGRLDSLEPPGPATSSSRRRRPKSGCRDVAAQERSWSSSGMVMTTLPTLRPVST
jgi:NADPH:quinone reductase-like Zn-dependent oxidoreductase